MSRRKATRSEAKSFSRICYIGGGILIALTPFSADPFPAVLVGISSVLFGLGLSFYAKPVSERKEEKKNRERQQALAARQERIQKRQAMYLENPQPMQIQDQNGVWLDVSDRLVIAKINENAVLGNASDAQENAIARFFHQDGCWYVEGKNSCTVNSKHACDRYQVPFTGQAVSAYQKPLMIMPDDLLDCQEKDKCYYFKIRAKQ